MVIMELGTFALIVSCFTLFLCLALLVPLYAKVFYSTHAVEYRPIEEIAKIRQSLGMDPKTPEEQVEEESNAGTLQAGDIDELWGAEPDELNDFLPTAKENARIRQDALRRARAGKGE